MSNRPQAFTFVAPEDPRRPDGSRAQRRSQINSHIAKSWHEQRKFNQKNAVLTAVGGHSIETESHHKQAKAARVEVFEVEVIAAGAQWSFNELEDIFHEQKPSEAKEESMTKRRLSHIELDSGTDRHALDIVRCQGTILNPEGAEREADHFARPTELHSQTDATKTMPQVAGAPKATRRPTLWGRNQRRWKIANPWQIRSSLDPFVHLPMETSKNEQALLQFYLTTGRRMLHGTSKRPLYCPTFEVASHALEHCPIYIQTHIAMAEHLLCRLQCSQLSANFYMRRAGAYKAANELILHETASFHERLSGLLHLQMIEYTVGRPDLQQMHVFAMDQLIESRGGLLVSLRPERDTHTLVEPAVLAVQYVMAEFRITDRSHLERIIKGFIESLRHIRSWVRNMRDGDTRVKSSAVDATKSSQLEEYINNLINSWLRAKDAPRIQAASAFHFIYALCVTLADNNFDRKDTTFLLESMQYHMEKSTDVDPSDKPFRRLFSGSAACMLSHVRRKFSPMHEPRENVQRELKICQACIDAAKIYPLLSTSTRLQLARNLAKCAFAMNSEISAGFLDEPELEDLSIWMHNSWQAQSDCYGNAMLADDDMSSS